MRACPSPIVAEHRQSDHTQYVLQVGGFCDPDPLPQLDECLELLCGLRGEKVTVAGELVAHTVDVATFRMDHVVIGVQQYRMKGAVTSADSWMLRVIDADEIPLSNSRNGRAFPGDIAKGWGAIKCNHYVLNASAQRIEILVGRLRTIAPGCSVVFWDWRGFTRYPGDW